MPEVSEFWNEQAKGYRDAHQGDWVERSHHRVTADLLNRELEGGRALCVGGPWVRAAAGLDLTVVDVSRRMLARYAAAGMTPVLGDGLRLPLAAASFDHVVAPLVWHHMTGPTGRTARANVRRAAREAARVLKPGGRLWVKEIVVRTPVYGLELALARLTRALLALKRIPLVIFHSDRFLRRSLLETGFEHVRSLPMASPHEKWHDWITPVIGLPALRVPRLLVPVRYRLIVGVRRSARGSSPR